MYREFSVSLIIPCYNEEEGIRMVLDKRPDFIDEIIVVDGGSTDRTLEVASSHKGVSILVERRRGYGLAYKAGFQRATGDIVVTSDGDGTYPLDAVGPIIDYLIEKRLDFVSASRFPLRNQSAMSFRNFFGNVLITFLMVLLFKEKITDGLSGMWIFKRRIVDNMKLISNTWNFSEEIKIEAIHHPQIGFGEFPIVYTERAGQTKLFPWRVGVENVLFLFYKRLAILLSGRRKRFLPQTEAAHKLATGTER